MQVIGCQLDIAWENKTANFAQVRRQVRRVAVERPALIVLPEMFATGFSMDVEKIAEGESGSTGQFLSEIASETGSYIVGGLVGRNARGQGLNQASLVGPKGQEITRYTKLHPFTYGGETRSYVAGTELTIVDVEEFRVAVFICYDLRFPEIFREAVRRGANVFVVIANWPQERDAHWQTLLEARAIENEAYVVGVNRTGSDPRLNYAGRSLIIDPRGQRLADAGNHSGPIAAKLDLPRLLEYRRTFPALDDMRAEFFVPFKGA